MALRCDRKKIYPDCWSISNNRIPKDDSGLLLISCTHIFKGWCTLKGIFYDSHDLLMVLPNLYDFHSSLEQIRRKSAIRCFCVFFFQKERMKLKHTVELVRKTIKLD